MSVCVHVYGRTCMYVCFCGCVRARVCVCMVQVCNDLGLTCFTQFLDFLNLIMLAVD